MFHPKQLCKLSRPSPRSHISQTNTIAMSDVIQCRETCSYFICRLLVTEDVVIRSVPLMTLTKEKSIGEQLLHTDGQLSGIPAKGYDRSLGNW
uniref:Ovule protein n=1 Tax=Heterorhabditis bacteriophora TaxID=37862 RepID=A0A1I7WH36_HETBA